MNDRPRRPYGQTKITGPGWYEARPKPEQPAPEHSAAARKGHRRAGRGGGNIEKGLQGHTGTPAAAEARAATRTGKTANGDKGPFYVHYLDEHGRYRVDGPFDTKAEADDHKYYNVIYDKDGNTKRGVSDVTGSTSPEPPTTLGDTYLKAQWNEQQQLLDQAEQRYRYALLLGLEQEAFDRYKQMGLLKDSMAKLEAKILVLNGDPRALYTEHDQLVIKQREIMEDMAEGEYRGDDVAEAQAEYERLQDRLAIVSRGLLEYEQRLPTLYGPAVTEDDKAHTGRSRYKMDPHTGNMKRLSPYYSPLNFTIGFSHRDSNQQAQIMLRALKALRTPGPNGQPPDWVVADPTRKLNSPITYEDEGRTARVGGKFKAYIIKDPPYEDPDSGDFVPSRITFMLPEEY